MSEAAAIELSESKDNRAEEQSTAEEQNLLETDDNIPVDHDQKVSSCLQALLQAPLGTTIPWNIGNLLLLLGVPLLVATLITSIFFFGVYMNFWFTNPRYQETRFLVIGDWGRNGGLNQTAVANAMAQKAEDFRPDFVISVGDNFYESGLTSVEDDQFSTSFTDVYSQKSLQIPWYAVLGNHDYGEWWADTKDLKSCPDNSTNCYFSPLHQLSNELRKRDKRWYCERWYEKSIPEQDATIFFIDTNPFILDYHSQAWSGNPGGILEQSWQAQNLELEARLAASEAKWKLVVGHHPVRNQHGPQNTPELIEHLEPVLEAQGVQAYFSGHEHNLQYMHVNSASTHYLISGAGSKTDYAADYWDNGGGRFQHQGSGFVSCSLSLSSLDCSFHGIASESVIYEVKIGQ